MINNTSGLHVIAIPGGTIVIQACDEKIAHIGVFDHIHDRNLYRHVSLPSLEAWVEPVHSWDLSSVKFDEILQANKTLVLETIDLLNQHSAAYAEYAVAFDRGEHAYELLSKVDDLRRRLINLSTKGV